MIQSLTKTGFALLVLVLLCADLSMADTVYLKSGRILTGKVTEHEADKGGKYIILTTETGAVYKLDESDIVKKVIPFSVAEVEYKKRLRLVRDIATDHVEIAKWCKKQDLGKTRFKEQIRWHHENVVRLDPDHKNARKELGYIKLPDGNWVAESEFKSRQGYVKVRTKWVPELSKQVKANDDEFDAKFGAKKKEFNRWVRAAENGNASASALANICDSSTVFLVYNRAIEINTSNNRGIEMLRVHLDAISTVRSGTAIRMMSQFAMMHPSKEIREHAIALLSQREIDHTTVVLTLAEGLLSTNRGIVEASAFAIGEVASTDSYSRDHAIVPLVNALVTEHDEKIPGALAAGRMNPSFGSGGSGLQMGGGPQTRKRKFNNQATLDALRRLFSEVRFGFDEKIWLDWYIQNYTLPDMTVRGEK